MATIRYVAPKSGQGTILRSYVLVLVLHVINIGKYEIIFSVGHLERTI